MEDPEKGTNAHLYLVLSPVLTTDITSVAFPSIVILLLRLFGRLGFFATDPSLYFAKIVVQEPDVYCSISTRLKLP